MATVSDGLTVGCLSGDSTVYPSWLPSASVGGGDVLLLSCWPGADDLDTANAASLVLTLAGDCPASSVWTVTAVGEDWQPSTVNGNALPDTTGDAVSVTVDDAMSAGDTVTFDLTDMVQAWLDGTTANRGILIARTDDGDSAPVATFAATTGVPVLATTTAATLSTPTDLSPAGGRWVSARQFTLRARGVASDLTTDIASMRVQWSATDDFTGTLLADDTLATTSPEFDMTQTTSGYELPDDGTQPYWRCLVTAGDGTDSGWSDPAQTGYKPVPGSFTMSSPAAAPGNTVYETMPDITVAFGGSTLTRVSLQLTTADDTTTLLPVSDTVTQASGTSMTVSLGYDIPDYADYIVTAYGWDDQDREDVPGAPSYATISRTFGVVDDSTVNPVSNLTVRPLWPGSPFNLLTFTFAQDTIDVRIRRDGKVASPITTLHAIGGDDEGGYIFQIIDWYAVPGILHTYRIQHYTSRRGSASGDQVGILTNPYGAGLANPTSGDWVQLLNLDVGSWTRPEPSTAAWAPLKGDAYWRLVKGQRFGMTTTCQATLAPDEVNGVSVADQWRAFERMATSNDELVLALPQVLVPCAIANIAEPPLDDPLKPVGIGFDVFQTDQVTKVDDDLTDDQGTSWMLDFEGGTDGDDLTDDDSWNDGHIASGSVEGDVTYSADAAAHGSGMGVHVDGTSDTSTFGLVVNPTAFTVDMYCVNGYSAKPSGPKTLLRLYNASDGQLCAVALQTAGTLAIQDGDSDNQASTSAKVTPGTPFRMQLRYRFISGTGHLLTVSLWVGSNMEGSSPDAVATATVSGTGVSNGVLQCFQPNGTLGFTIDVDDIRGSNTDAATFAPLGAAAMDADTMLTGDPAIDGLALNAGGIVGADQICFAYSTSQDDDGYPASPSFTDPVDVDETGHARLVTTGWTAGTTYYVSPASIDGVCFGQTASGKTFPAANTSYTVKVGNLSCQCGAGSSTTTAAWDDLASWGPDLNLFGGDLGYYGGVLHPSSTWQTHVSRIDKQMMSLPAMRAGFQRASAFFCISDHDVCANDQYRLQPGDPGYDPTAPFDGDDAQYSQGYALGLPIIAANLIAYQHAIPQRPYALGTVNPRNRCRYLDLGHNGPDGAVNLRLIHLDFRGMDKTNGMVADGADKTAYDSAILDWLASVLLPKGTGLNVIFHEGAWWADPEDPPTWNGCDKQWAFQHEQINVTGPMLAAVDTDYLGGDRHILGFLDHTKNPQGGFDVCISSGMEMHGLGLQPGELYLDSDGTQQVFGDAKDQDVAQYGRVTYADDNAGTITRVFTGWDAISGSAKIGPFTRTFTYSTS